MRAGLDLGIVGGTVVTPDGARPADLGVRAGRIACVAMPGTLPPSERMLDATGCLVLPGLVDPHVQVDFTLQGTPVADDFPSGTAAAARGGVTTIIDKAYQVKGGGLLEALHERRRRADGRVRVDYALHMHMVDFTVDALAEIPRVVAEGVRAFKVYMAYSRAGRMIDDGQLRAVMGRLADAGGLLCVHAEVDAIVERATQALLEAGRRGVEHYPASRPAVAEVAAIQRAILLAEETGCPLYLKHVSTARGADEVRRAKARGLPVWGETCPHYLILTEDVYGRPDGARFVVNPPVRGAEDRDALWAALRDGTIDTVGTDHAAFPLARKHPEPPSFDRVAPGFPGLETLLPLLYTEGVAKGRLPLERLVAVASRHPAELFGLADRKGAIRVGADADLVVYRPDREGVIRAAGMATRGDFTPFEGMRTTGAVALTLLRGEVVYAEDEEVRDTFRGEFVPAQPSAVSHQP